MIVETGEHSLNMFVVEGLLVRGNNRIMHAVFFPVLEEVLNFSLMGSRIIMWHSLANQIHVSIKKMTTSVVFMELLIIITNP